MKNTNEPNNTPVTTTDMDHKKLVKSVAKVVLIAATALFSIAGAQAMFTDHTLSGLETSFKSAVVNYDKLVKQANDDIKRAEDSKQLASEAYALRCNVWKATKSYKEAKQLELTNPEYNPCTEPSPFQPTEQSQSTVQ